MMPEGQEASHDADRRERFLQRKMQKQLSDELKSIRRNFPFSAALSFSEVSIREDLEGFYLARKIPLGPDLYLFNGSWSDLYRPLEYFSSYEEARNALLALPRNAPINHSTMFNRGREYTLSLILYALLWSIPIVTAAAIVHKLIGGGFTSCLT